MKIIGITGPTGAGKTTALRTLTEFRVLIIDADVVYHTLLAGNAVMRAALVTRFGSILDSTGAIDRKNLGSLVFSDPIALADLNKITHSFVGEETERQISQAKQAGQSVAIDAISLIESGLGARCDVTIAVLAPQELRVKRIMDREYIPEEYARKRVAAQKNDDFFRANCTYVLENTEEDTVEQFSAKARALFLNIL